MSIRARKMPSLREGQVSVTEGHHRRLYFTVLYTIYESEKGSMPPATGSSTRADGRRRHDRDQTGDRGGGPDADVQSRPPRTAAVPAPIPADVVTLSN